MQVGEIVVLKGAGNNFCAGLDLKVAMARRAGQQEPPSVTESLDSQRRIADIVMLMRRCPQPIISLVQGAAAGGGSAAAAGAAGGAAATGVGIPIAVVIVAAQAAHKAAQEVAKAQNSHVNRLSETGG